MIKEYARKIPAYNGLKIFIPHFVLYQNLRSLVRILMSQHLSAHSSRERDL